MNVAILADPGNADGTIGGAELTMQEFAEAAPADVTLTDDLDTADTVIVGNCVTFPASLIDDLLGKYVVRYHNDLARHENPVLRAWLEDNAVHVFTSPLHREKACLPGETIPPPIHLARFRPPKKKLKRSGACAIAPWQNPGKGQQLLKEWSDENGPLDLYGAGAYVPHGENLRYVGALSPGDVAKTLWKYRTFVHLPTAPEPFGRAVVEAWAAGCDLVVNRLVGALHYIEHEPEKLETAAEDFWALVVGERVAA